jgi:hypothetical protein
MVLSVVIDRIVDLVQNFKDDETFKFIRSRFSSGETKESHQAINVSLFFAQGRE